MITEKELEQAEEDLLEENPTVKAEIQEARDAYEAGDYLTIEEYIAKRVEKADYNRFNLSEPHLS